MQLSQPKETSEGPCMGYIQPWYTQTCEKNTWGIILDSCIWKIKKNNSKESKTLGQRSRGVQVSPSLVCNWNCPCCTLCIAAHSIHMIFDCLCQQAMESCSCESTPITRVGSIPNSIKKSSKKGQETNAGINRVFQCTPPIARQRVVSIPDTIYTASKTQTSASTKSESSFGMICARVIPSTTSLS